MCSHLYSCWKWVFAKYPTDASARCTDVRAQPVLLFCWESAEHERDKPHRGDWLRRCGKTYGAEEDREEPGRRAIARETHRMLARTVRINSVAARRFVATASKSSTATKTQEKEAGAATGSSTALTGEDPLDVIPSSNYPQAPNRAETWSQSQKSRDEIYKTDPRFVGKDLSKQPQSLAAIELIKQQPVSFIHGNIAVCHGTDFVQGHPKVYINLDKDKAHSCGYCGARYAREELKNKL